MQIAALLPGVGRDLLTLWAPSVTVATVGSGTMTVDGPDLDVFGAFVGGGLMVYAPDGAMRGTLTGTAWAAPDTLTWSGGSATPLAGDVVTLADRTPVVFPAGVDGAIGYIAGVADAEGDGLWQ
jgi:hypothetical protein